MVASETRSRGFRPRAGGAALCAAWLLLSLLVPRAPGPGADGGAGAAAARAAAAGISERAARIALAMSPLGAPPPDPTNRVADDPRAAALGQRLFFDPLLSRDGTLSCASCHDPARSFSDGLPVAQGLGPGTRRTPSLWNVAFQESFFWDGRADTLWAQALQPLEDPREMDGSRVDVARHIAADPELARAFEELFGALPAGLLDPERFPPGARPARPAGDPRGALAAGAPAGSDPRARAWRAMAPADRGAVDEVFVGAGKALAAYQRLLVRGDSPFDRFVRGLADGDPGLLGSLSPEARRGLELFVGKAGCRSCHHGPLLQDGAFHDVLLPGPGGGLPSDAGRYAGLQLALRDPFNAASRHSDRPDGPAARRLAAETISSSSFAAFKTPTLRNVAERAPYMHRGQLASLEEVVRHYSTLEGAVRAHAHAETVLVPLGLTEDEQAELVAFLEALTGAPPDARLLAPPPGPLPPGRDP